MTTPHAFNFLVVGLGMIAGPAVWPQYFTGEHLRSTLWLEVMGGLQAVGGSWVLGLEGVALFRRMQTWESFDLSFKLPDIRWAVSPSFYSLLEDNDEVKVALLLQRQLRQPVAA